MKSGMAARSACSSSLSGAGFSGGMPIGMLRWMPTQREGSRAPILVVTWAPQSPPIPAGPARRLGEPVARERGRDHVERVSGPASVGLRVGEPGDNVEELD